MLELNNSKILLRNVTLLLYELGNSKISLRNITLYVSYTSLVTLRYYLGTLPLYNNE